MTIDRKCYPSEREEAQRLADAVLRGELTILEGVRSLVRFAHTDAIQDEEERRLIIGIDSETDDLPVGEVRALWSSEALREKDVEIARCEALWREKVITACRRIAG